MRLHKKLLLNFIIMSTIPMLISIFIVSAMLFNSLKKNAEQSLTHTVVQYAREMDYIFDEAAKIDDIIQSDLDYQKAVRDPLLHTPGLYSYNFQIDSKLLDLQQSYSNNIFGVYIIADDNRKYKSSIFGFFDTNFTSKDWYHKIRQNPNSYTWFGLHRDSFLVSTINKYFITQGKPLIDMRTGKPFGIVAVDIPVQKLMDIISNTPFNGMAVLLTEADGTLVCSNHTFSRPKIINNIANLPQESNYRFVLPEEVTDKSAFDLRHTVTLKNGWVIGAYASSLSILKDNLFFPAIIILGTLTISIAYAILFSARISRSISAPLTNMLELMQKVSKGDLSAQMHLEDNKIYEMTQFGTNLNYMINEISHLINCINEEQTLIRKAQFGALQAQINPHFLYNTLDHIAWSIRINKNDRALEMIMALAKFFRLSLCNGKDVISLRDEIEHTKTYLTIQQKRFADQLIYEFNISDDRILNYYNPNLIIQPIVENSLNHGILKKREGGIIKINVYEKEKNVNIEVLDTGVGIRTDQIKIINDKLKNTSIRDFKEFDGYGIFNVDLRIKFYYGEQYGLTFESIYGEYTLVKIVFPAQDTVNHDILNSNKLH